MQKYIALPASLPSGLNKQQLLLLLDKIYGITSKILGGHCHGRPLHKYWGHVPLPLSHIDAPEYGVQCSSVLFKL